MTGVQTCALPIWRLIALRSDPLLADRDGRLLLAAQALDVVGRRRRFAELDPETPEPKAGA